MEKEEEGAEEDGKGNNSEVDHAFCLEARLRTSKIVLRPIFLPLRSFHSLFLSSSSLLSSILGRSSSSSSLLTLSPSLSLFSFSHIHIHILSLSLFGSQLWLSSPLPISFPQRRVDACVRTQARKVLLSLTPMQAQRRASDLVSLSPFLTLPLSFSFLSSRSRFSPPL